MANVTISDKFEESIKEDCNKLYDVLKRCENLNNNNGDDNDNDDENENLKYLYRITFLLSCHQNAKMAAVTTYTISYICNHPTLPVILVEILRESKIIKNCIYVLDILAKLIIKNVTTSETDRKTIRRVFAEPERFKLILEAFHRIYANFISEKTNVLFYEMQVRILKIINCLYIRKGYSQISLINPSTVQFVGRHLVTYKSHKDISQCLLPLIKVLCRNRKNCSLICYEAFLNALILIVTTYNKHFAAITILKLMSKNSDAVEELSKSEKVFNFLLNTINYNCEKQGSKKSIMITLYRMTKTYTGAQNISKQHLWSQLIEFFTKCENLSDTKLRLTAIKAYTILNRSVKLKTLSITPLNLNFQFHGEIQKYISEFSNHHSDDSDNEESDEEDDKPLKDLNKNSSDENDESDESEIESETECSNNNNTTNNNNNDNEESTTTTTTIPKENNNDLNSMKQFFVEFYDINNDKMRKNLNNSIAINENINRLAFPDAVLAESDISDNSFITPNINYFSSDEMVRKVKTLKGLYNEQFKKKIVFDLDELIAAKIPIDIPEAEVNKSHMHLNFDSESINHKNSHLVKQSHMKSIKYKRNPPTLEFESRFECGNLRRVEQVGDVEYNLYLSPDINMTNGLQWFYFQISNMLASECYVFNIINFQKVNSQFNYGLQPVIFSVIDYLRNSSGWKRGGEKIVYFGNEYFNKTNEKQFRTLSFTIKFPYENDYCYLAYHFPYTYSRLMTVILPYLNPSSNIYSRVDILSNTVNDFNEVPLLTITAAFNKYHKTAIPLKERPLVFLSARVHPGESNSSWIMDGIVQFLLNEQDESALKAREHYIFKIIPMLNPEGVIYGNSRCGLTENDLNRCWKKPHPVLHPEIYYAKKLVQFAKEQLEQPIFTFIDIHGHSRKKFYFLYGCNPKQSWNANDKLLADSSDFSYNLLPNALCHNEHFKLSYCHNTIERKRESTCRVVMWREFGIKSSYTLECSFCSGENKKKMTTTMLRDIGISIITALTNLT